jgi:tetratricopeptide (TPR) repeat protein
VPGVSGSDNTNTEARFRQATVLHRAARADEAEAICEAISTHQPDHYGALHLLAVIALQSGRTERALELVRRAIAARPDSAEAHIALGAVLTRLGRGGDALATYERAVALRPDDARTHYHHGNALRNLGRTEQSLASYSQAIVPRPDLWQAHYNRGNALRDLGRGEEALVCYDTAAALNPDFAGVHTNRGKVLRELGRYADALRCHDRVISLKPDFAEAHNNRGNALRDLGRFEEALASYNRALALRPDFAEAHANRGSALADLGRYTDALSALDRGIALKPDHADAYDDLGAILAGLGQHGEAIFQFDHALALRPNRARSHTNRANALRDRGRHEEAMVHYGAALAARPDFADAHWNQALCQLAMGDYTNGWRGFEWRWQSERAEARREFPGPCWLGDFPIDGKTIFVHAEQGLGDILQFCRYVPLLAQRARVVLESPPELTRLLGTLPGAAKIVTRGEPLPDFDAWVPLMSLPLAFATMMDSIPAPIPYFHADPERTANWTRRLAALPGRKVGLVWAGSPRRNEPRGDLMDRRRSLPLGSFAPLTTVEGISLVSLQKGEPAAQARTPPDGMTLHDRSDELADFADTAALVQALDLVISVDTAVVHLAGGLGKPVWVLNRYDQCWRWLRDRTDSPWYPTARLFRQHAPGDWCGIIEDIVRALRDWR